MKFAGLNLKADAIYEEIRLQEMLEMERREEGRLVLPLTVHGVMVGMCKIRRDGSFVADIESNGPGQQLVKALLEGRANCLDLGPNPVGPKHV